MTILSVSEFDNYRLINFVQLRSCSVERERLLPVVDELILLLKLSAAGQQPVGEGITAADIHLIPRNRLLLPKCKEILGISLN